ncbi:MAG: hypothetical protein CMJ85_02530 [Planctomycetes bacterium]|jgi:Tfp pilus assembly PilM family ATPase|nr:hypothetical protein [Planctomycetota bacterium]
MASKGIGLDLSSESATLCEGRKKGVTFQVTGFRRLAVAGGRMTGVTDPLGACVAGLTGRDLILKYSRVPQVPDWQLQKLMDFEVQEIAAQAGGDLASDFNMLPIVQELTGEDTVLLALAKSEALAATDRIVQAARGTVASFTPNAVALLNAYLTVGPVTEEDIVLLAWIGDTSLDLALVRGQSLLFARNVSGGLKVLDGAISQAFNVREERAQKIRRELLNLDPRARGSFSSSQQEKVSHSVQGVAGQLQAALRSTIAFCQSQTGIQELALRRVLICGPGASIEGMDAFLAEGAGCAVDCWNPTNDLDLSICPPEDAQELMQAGPESVLALGLAMTPLFDDLYSIEILPEAVKKKRRFMQQTLWNIVAAVLALAFLGWRVLDGKAYHGQAAKNAKVADAQLRRVKKAHGTIERTVAENEVKRQRLAELSELSVPLHGIVRALREVRATLPADLWLTRVRSANGTASWVKPPTPKPGARRSSKRANRRTYVTFEGKGVQITGDDLRNSVYPKFQRDAKARGLPIRAPSAKTGSDFGFTWIVDYLDPAAPSKGGN